MINADTCRLLMRYKAWANTKIFDAMAALPPGEVMKERVSLFKNMVNTMGHLYAVDLVWKGHLEGKPHGIPALNHVIHEQMEALRPAQEASDRWFIEWADGLSDAHAAERVTFTLIGGNQGEMTRGDVALHLANHTSYHRGFAADMFFQVPARPPTMDLPVFYRETGFKN
jgi:uncharacterized damage-inducible protein DinB